MSVKAQFTLCPRCGVRNFADDDFCGVCSAKLPKIESPATDKDWKSQALKSDSEPVKPPGDKPEEASNANMLRAVAVFAGIALFAILLFRKSCSKPKEPKHIPSRSLATAVPTPPHTDSNTYSLNYSIVKQELGNPNRAVIDVRLEEMIPHDKLIQLALGVKQRLNINHPRTYMAFLLPEMRGENGAWASADFEPGLKIRYMGNSYEEQQRINKQAQRMKDFIGLWVDRTMPGDVVIRIRQDKIYGYAFEYISAANPKPSELASPLRKFKVKGKDAYRDIESDAGEYFVIEADGNLSAYDRDGFIATFHKIK